jgi:hypothetical protein
MSLLVDPKYFLNIAVIKNYSHREEHIHLIPTDNM